MLFGPKQCRFDNNRVYFNTDNGFFRLFDFRSVPIANPGPPPDCTDAGWYQGNVKLISSEDERSAALYKAAINKVGEVYPGAKLAVCEAADIPSRPRARVWLPSEPSEPAC